jgi:hypothetical protein
MWPAYTAAGDQDMTLNLPASMVETAHDKTNCDFWDSIYP